MNPPPLADFGSRLLAYLIDYALYFALSLILTVPMMIWWLLQIFNLAEQQSNGSAAEIDPLRLFLPMLGFVVAVTLLGLVFTYLYFVEYQLRGNGQTLGKRVMKLRVVPVDPAATLTRSDLLKRWAVQWLAGSFVPIFLYLDGFWQLWDKPLQQCLHDKAASTVVIKI